MTIRITREKFDQFKGVHASGLVMMGIVGMIVANTFLTKAEALELMQNRKKYEDMYSNKIVTPDKGIIKP